MSTNLERIGEKARQEPGLVFTTLYHHVSDVGNLRACYDALPKDRAVGIDGVSKEEYGNTLDSNLHSLAERLRRMGYCPQPKRRVYIPKPGSEKGRPLGIRMPTVHYITIPTLFGMRDHHPSPSSPTRPAM